MENSNKNKWFYLISLLLITANIAVLAILFIHRGGHDRPPHPAGPQQQGSLFEYLSKELSLTKEQQAAYDTMRTEHHENSMKLQDSIRANKDAFFNMLQQNNVSEDAITAQANKVAALEAQLDILTYHHFQKLRAICTPDQQKKFDEIIQDAIRSMGRRQQGPPPQAASQPDSVNGNSQPAMSGHRPLPPEGMRPRGPRGDRPPPPPGAPPPPEDGGPPPPRP